MFGSTNRLKSNLFKQVQRISSSTSSGKAACFVELEAVDEAIVTQTIAPGRKGQVKYQGSWWTARCSGDRTFTIGKRVRVISRQSLTLHVEPAEKFANAIESCKL